MSSDRTEYQSPDEIRKSRDLSLEPQQPPSKVPGYTLQNFLGSGAYGEVWSATNQKTGRKVAIKFYTRRSAADIQLLAREVEKLVVLQADRYVVQLLDVGWDAEPPYFVMDYIEHGSLEDRLAAGKPIPTDDSVELFKELANGMMHLHGKGILHCDLKPGNVLLDQDGKPRVADFGQSRLSTENSSALGTLFYMAPEQADIEASPDARWDVYGLGALLFSMLTGKPPYYSPELARDIEETVDIRDRLGKYRQALNTADKPTAHRKVPGVDRMLADIIDGCIAANPKDRFTSIQGVLFALKQRENAKARRPLMLLGLLGPLLLLAVMSGFGWWAFTQSVGDTEKEITRKARESNLFAAKFAARSAAEQIDEYFRVVGQLARDPEFIEAFQEFDEDVDLLAIRNGLADPNRNNPFSQPLEIRELRTLFTENELRKKLATFLENRMNDPNGDFPLAASWFINDRAGIQVASVFRTDDRSETMGMNWAYRTYFSGLDRDLISEVDGKLVYDVPQEVEKRKIIERPHLCAIFLSKASNTWKIAFSFPIEIAGEVRGVVAATAEVGNFVEFDGDLQHYAVLVDNRDGDNKGVVLEHPLFHQLTKVGEKIPDSLTNSSIDIDSFDDNTLFNDPVANDEVGRDYGGDAIVAVAPVTMKWQVDESTDGTVPVEEVRRDTGLFVVTVEDHESIIAPAEELAQRLGRLAATAIAFFLLVALAMWTLVMRMLRESRMRLDRSFSPGSESSLLESMETVGAPELISNTQDFTRSS